MHLHQSEDQKSSDKLSDRVHIARQGIPGFNGETPWIKGALQNPREGGKIERKRGKRRERRNNQETVGNIGLYSQETYQDILVLQEAS